MNNSKKLAERSQAGILSHNFLVVINLQITLSGAQPSYTHMHA